MPIYEYKCMKCGSEFELYLKSSKEAPECPNCSSKKLEKKISGFVARDSETSECACKVSKKARPCEGNEHHCNCHCHHN